MEVHEWYCRSSCFPPHFANLKRMTFGARWQGKVQLVAVAGAASGGWQRGGGGAIGFGLFSFFCLSTQSRAVMMIIIPRLPHYGNNFGTKCCGRKKNVSKSPPPPPPPPGGGGTSILKVSGTCRWTGYDFAIIAIKTGCLNQPNHWHRVSKSAYLATGTDYSVYHRVAFPPTMFMTGPRSRHRRNASVRAGPVFQRSLIFFLMNGS